MRSDREKWDNRYRHRDPPSFEPDPLLLENANLLGKGLALDLACGYGGNALFAANRGYSVHAVDISLEALSALNKEARRLGLAVRCVVGDLDNSPIPADAYDLVMVFYFFSEGIMKAIKNSLKRGGMLFYATFNYRHTSLKPEFNRAYLVSPGGLGRYFNNLEILLDEPEAGRDKNISRLITRKS